MLKINRFAHKLTVFLLTLTMIISNTSIGLTVPASAQSEPFSYPNEDSTFFLKSSNVGIDEDYFPESADIEQQREYEDSCRNAEDVPTVYASTDYPGDPMVYLTQKWLNQEYGDVEGFGSVTENGKTGWNVVYGLTRALQHELGITTLANNFGPSTSSLYSQNLLYRQDGVTNRMYAILQGALWCKGYNPGYYLRELSDGTVVFDEIFDALVERAVIEMKTDAGLLNPDGTVTVNVMKALLSMDSFKMLSTYYGAKPQVRLMQQKINREYEEYTGLIPCDGVYGRNTNKALIYAIQAVEGLPIGTATGNFGPTTKNLLPQLPYTAEEGAATDYQGNYYTSAKIQTFTEFMQFALFINGFGDGVFNGQLNKTTKQAIHNFQVHYALPKTGIVDITTWMSLLISSGDPNRTAIAADCATILNEAKAQTLYNNGYRYIGRYLTGTYGGGISKALTIEEANIILNAGLRFFPIYQTSSNSEGYFTESRGTYDAEQAINAAMNLGIPADTIIYFAVDFDAMDYQITDSVIPYFSKVYETVSGSGYKVGVYGARNVCSRVAAAGYSVSSFVGDMSTGFSGNLGFKIPDNWAFSQFANLEGSNALGTGDGRIEIDKDAFSGRDQGVGKLNSVTKKAIYVLPGYMGSKLYDSNGDEYWADQNKLENDITDYIIWGEASSKKGILRLDDNGENSNLHVDMEKDLYGTPLDDGDDGTYYNLITQLKSECPNYDVVFFPYNWLADLNDSVTALQNHINANGYKQVVFVTHSTGGLLASAYIARGYANKKKVEKAILIAPPLYGTYSSLNPIETGVESLIVDRVSDALKDYGKVGSYATVQSFVLGRAYKFVRKAVHNSPTTYQLLPSLEYLKMMPQLYLDAFEEKTSVTTMYDYYQILNNSENINSNLTNGNNRSHKKFRENIGDIVSVLQEVDTLIIGTSYGYETFAVANYAKLGDGKTEFMDITYKSDGDGTVLAASAFALSPTGEHTLKYKDFAGEGKYDHYSLATKLKPIKYVCNYINGKETESDNSVSSREGEVANEGMATKLKINYQSNTFVSIEIFDDMNECVAELSDVNFFGFNDDSKFTFSPISFTDEKYKAVMYIPNSGYRIVFSKSGAQNIPIEFTADVSVLNKDGWKVKTVTNSVAETSTDGIVFAVDGTQTPIDCDSIISAVNGVAIVNQLDWEIPTTIKLNLGTSQEILITGEGTNLNASVLTWSTSNEGVATVTDSGVITAVGYGEAVVSATNGDKICSCCIYVSEDTSSVAFDDLFMVLNERKLIKPVFSTNNVYCEEMTYTYDNSNIVRIDEFGVVQALTSGTVLVTGSTANGITNTFQITVRDADFIYEKGDANGDEEIDIRDMVRLKKHLCNYIILDSKCLNAADMNSDGAINACDLMLLKKKLLGVVEYR